MDYRPDIPEEWLKEYRAGKFNPKPKVPPLAWIPDTLESIAVAVSRFAESLAEDFNNGFVAVKRYFVHSPDVDWATVYAQNKETMDSLMKGIEAIRNTSFSVNDLKSSRVKSDSKESAFLYDKD